MYFSLSSLLNSPACPPMAECAAARLRRNVGVHEGSRRICRCTSRRHLRRTRKPLLHCVERCCAKIFSGAPRRRVAHGRWQVRRQSSRPCLFKTSNPQAVKVSQMPKSKYPTVAAYEPGPSILKERPSLYKSWLVPCPFCGLVHVHGAITPGPDANPMRSPHCPHPESWHGFLFEGRARPQMYCLKYAGVINDPKIFAAAAKRTTRLYAAYLKEFANRSKVRVRESRAAFRALSKRPAATSC